MMQISATELKARLVSFAREIGFDSCRVAACNAPAHANEFREWLRDGAHGEMNYMQRGEEKRCDPQKVLPGARSIVVLALNYFQGDAAHRAAATGRTGRIARYAWGDDYHDVIEAKLNRIDEFLRSFGGQQKCYVDTGPVLERDHAAQAGIGWHGKSTMLIDERLGTWFFLAEILTTLELPPDEPVPDRCGTCDRCITACPTGAITAAASVGRAPVHFLPNDRTENRHPCGASSTHGRSDLWLRRLSGRLPLEPVRPDVARSCVLARADQRLACRCGNIWT